MQKIGTVVTVPTARNTSPSLDTSRIRDMLPNSASTNVKSSLSDVISALEPKGRYGLRWDPKTKTDSWDLLGEEPQKVEYVKNALGSLYDDVERLQGTLASKKMISDALARLMAIKHASSGGATLTVLINEIAEDFHGRISALSLLIAYQQLKEANSPWYPPYHEIAQVFKKLTENSVNLEKEVNKKLQIAVVQKTID